MFWHELCVNSVGVIREVLTAWEVDSITFTDVKRILDVFRSKICSLPVCISAWLCSYIQVIDYLLKLTPSVASFTYLIWIWYSMQVSTEEKCAKAKEILSYFLNPVMTFDNQDHFKERSDIVYMFTEHLFYSFKCLNFYNVQFYPFPILEAL